jgi:hypothetical protein
MLNRVPRRRDGGLSLSATRRSQPLPTDAITCFRRVKVTTPTYAASLASSGPLATLPRVMTGSVVVFDGGSFSYAPEPPHRLDPLLGITAAGRIRGILERQAATAPPAAQPQPSRTAGLAGGALPSGHRRAVADRYRHGREMVRVGADRGCAGRAQVADTAGGCLAAGAAVDSRAVAAGTLERPKPVGVLRAARGCTRMRCLSTRFAYEPEAD